MPVTAVIDAPRTAFRRPFRRDTPTRLRLWSAAAIITAAALLATTSLLMARVQQQVRIIGDVAAPQAGTASDLYFALSDTDAQVARLVLIGDSDALADSQIDALGTYQERGRQIDRDLQACLTGATNATGRATVLDLLDELAVYRARVAQTLAATTDTSASSGNAGFYTQATNVMHLDLLPAAERLRDASERELAAAYASKTTSEHWAIALAAGLGLLLVLFLIILQAWLSRRFRRTLNPALIVATLLTIALVLPAISVLALESRRLGDARTGSLGPFLDLSKARAISYDAAADTSRYLISKNLGLYADDFQSKSDCLVKGGSCGPGNESIAGGLAAVAGGADVSPDASAQVVRRWQAYVKDHERIVGLSNAGNRAAAIDALTGIQRGDAAFDFYYYDVSVDKIAAERKQSYDAALHDSRQLLTGWTFIPIIALGLVIVLIPLGVRRRLAEYR